MANEMKRSDPVTATLLVKVTAQERRAIEAAARAEMRSLSNWLRAAALETLERTA